MRSRRSVLRTAGASLLVATAGCSSGLTGEPDPTIARERGWTEETAMPAAQSDMASGVVDGELYCFGGILSDRHLDATARGFVYDPADGDGGSWSPIPDQPLPLWGQCGVSDGDRIFAFGGAFEDSPYQTGLPPTDDIFVYDPGDGWTNLSKTAGVTCPYETWVMQGVYNPRDGLIYNVGGAAYDREDYSDEFDWVWTFDPERAEVVDEPLTRVPTKRRWATVGLVEVDGSPTLHVMAGQADHPTGAHHRYDVEADEWREAAPVPESGIYASNFDPVIDDRIYLTHGLLWAPGDVPTEDDYALACWAYDPVDDEWNTELEQPTHVRGAGAADGVIDGTLFVAGGHRKRYDTDNYHEAVPHVESFTP